MNTVSAFVMFFIGIIVTLFGVGGVENSVNDSELIVSATVSAVGLMIMALGLLATKVSEYYDR